MGLLFCLIAPNLAISKPFNCQKGCFVVVGPDQKKRVTGLRAIYKPINNFFLNKEKIQHISLCREEEKKQICSEMITFLWARGTDKDKDGLSTTEEAELGTDPNKYDTDNDKLSDGEESLIWGTNSTDDFDGDGKSNILDPRSYGNNYLDGDNPELRKINVVVVHDDNKDNPVYSFFDTLVSKEKKEKEFDEMNTLSFFWTHNKDTTIGYKLYYRRVDQGQPSAKNFKEKCNGTGLYPGNSPIDVGWENHVKLSGMDVNYIYEFAVTAYNSNGDESSVSKIIKAVGVKLVHKYPDKDTEIIFWANLGASYPFLAKERAGYKLRNIMIDSKSSGIKKSVDLIVNEPGHEIIFSYQ